MTTPSRHDIEWTATRLRRAAAEIGVILPVDYSRRVTADGLQTEPELAVTRLGDGVVIHTHPDSERRLPLLLGYADARGQWYRDGRRHQPISEATAPAADTTVVPL